MRFLFALSLLFGLQACAADTHDLSASSDVDVVGATPLDAAVMKELAEAAFGLTTTGGDGPPDAYEVADLPLARRAPLDRDVLVKRLLPKLIGVVRDAPFPGVDETPIAIAWAELTADPDPAEVRDPARLAAARKAAAQWRTVKQVVAAHLHDVKYVDIGYRTSRSGSLETGAVAHVVVGRTASGRVVALWGIDVWT